MKDCLFCKIINGEIPAGKVYEDDGALVFLDIHPAAPVHALVVPKRHVVSLDQLSEENLEAVSGALLAIPKAARALGLTNGYRVISNVGKDGAQSVNHLHFHLLGGTKLSEKLN